MVTGTIAKRINVKFRGKVYGQEQSYTYGNIKSKAYEFRFQSSLQYNSNFNAELHLKANIEERLRWFFNPVAVGMFNNSAHRTMEKYEDKLPTKKLEF